MMGSKDPETATANEEAVAMTPRKLDPSPGMCISLLVFPLMSGMVGVTRVMGDKREGFAKTRQRNDPDSVLHGTGGPRKAEGRTGGRRRSKRGAETL